MGRNHVRVLDEFEDVELVGVADLDLASLNRAVGKRALPTFLDYRRLLDETRPELVTVAVPTAMHFEVTMAALESGASVLVEKPIAATVAEAEQMVTRARQLGRVLSVGHIERFNPAVAELRRRVRAGELGRIYQIRARRCGPYPTRIRDVGVVVDLASHDIDIARDLMGENPLTAYAVTHSITGSGREDLLAGVLMFPNSCAALLDVNWLTPVKIRELSVLGERSMFEVNYLTQDLLSYEVGGLSGEWDHLKALSGTREATMTKLPIAKVEPLRAQLRAFVDAVATGEAPVVTGEDGLASLVLAHALLRSAVQKQVVQVHAELAALSWA